jgi:hypothetical protein
MALDYEKIKKTFDAMLKRELKELTLKDIDAQFDTFVKAYDNCLKLEQALEDTIPGARERGNNGTDAKGLSRDAIFKKAYKEYDASVDVIDKAEKQAFVFSTKAAAIVGELENLRKALEKDKPKSKDKDVIELLKSLEKKIDEMNKAADVYDTNGKHRKMRTYSSKFDDRVQKIIDRGPQPENPEDAEAPKALQPNELDRAVEVAKKMADAVIIAGKNIVAIVDTAKDSYTSEIDRKTKLHEKLIDANTTKLTTFVGKIQALFVKSKRDLEALKREERREIEERMEKLAAFVTDCKKIDDDTDKRLKTARAKMK